MKIVNSEAFISRTLGIGAFLTTVLVYTQVTDPVNVPKMVVLATLAFGILGSALCSHNQARLGKLPRSRTKPLFVSPTRA